MGKELNAQCPWIWQRCKKCLILWDDLISFSDSSMIQIFPFADAAVVSLGYWWAYQCKSLFVFAKTVISKSVWWTVPWGSPQQEKKVIPFVTKILTFEGALYIFLLCLDLAWNQNSQKTIFSILNWERIWNEFYM